MKIRTLLFRGIGGLVGIALLVLLVLVLKPIRPTVPKLQPRESTRYWTMSGGYRIAYAKVDADAPLVESTAPLAPIIFLHGGPGAYVHSSTIETVGRLSSLGRDVYLYDQSGTGLSDRRRPKATSFASHIADLHEIVDVHVGAPRVVLIGHSYGGELAANFAARYPDRVDRLVLSSPGNLQPARFDAEGRWLNLSEYPVPDDLEFIEVAETFARDTSLSRLPWRARVSVGLAFVFDIKLASDDELDAALNTMATGFMHNAVCDPANIRPEEGGGGAYSRTSANFYPDDLVDPREQLRQFDRPVLVLQGQCDYIPYAAAYEYTDLAPQGEYRFIEGAGHIIWWDRPDRYVEEIASFLTPIASELTPGS